MPVGYNRRRPSSPYRTIVGKANLGARARAGIAWFLLLCTVLNELLCENHMLCLTLPCIHLTMFTITSEEEATRFVASSSIHDRSSPVTLAMSSGCSYLCGTCHAFCSLSGHLSWGFERSGSAGFGRAGSRTGSEKFPLNPVRTRSKLP